jgi:hypothetical protein
LEQKQATLNTLIDQQQQLFLLVVQRFIETINERLSKSPVLANVEIKIEEGEKPDPTSNPNWLKWVSERFEDVLLVVRIKYFSTF